MKRINYSLTAIMKLLVSLPVRLYRLFRKDTQQLQIEDYENFLI